MSSFQIEDRLSNTNPPVVASPSADCFSYLRPWRYPSPLAWAVVLIVGSILAYGQFLRVEHHGKTPPPSFSVGWPYPYAWKDSSSKPLDYIRWRSLAGDVGRWFAMTIPVLIIAERLVRSRFRPSAKTLISATAAATILSIWTDWESFYIGIKYEPGLALFELALLGVSFCWLQIVVLGVVGSFTTVWNLSSNLFTAVGSLTIMGVTVFGSDMFLYSNGFIRADNYAWDCLNWTMVVGAFVILLFGASVWLIAAVREIIDNFRKLQRIESR